MGRVEKLQQQLPLVELPFPWSGPSNQVGPVTSNQLLAELPSQWNQLVTGQQSLHLQWVARTN